MIMNLQRRVFLFLLLFIGNATFAQKVPVQGKLFEVVNTQSFGVSPRYFNLLSANDGDFWWPRQMKTEQIGGLVYSDFQLCLMSAEDLTLKDSLRIGPTFHLASADRDSLGNIFLTGLFSDSLYVNDSIISSTASTQAVVLKIGLDLKVKEFFTLNENPSEISVSKNGEECIILIDDYTENQQSGLFHYTTKGNLIKYKWYNLLLNNIKLRVDKGVYFSGLCGGYTIDTVNTNWFSSFNLFYGSLDSNLTAVWVKHIAHNCQYAATVIEEGPNSSLIMGNQIHEGFSFEGSQVQVGDGFSGNIKADIFINSHELNGDFNYFLDAPTVDVPIVLLDLHYVEGSTTILAEQFHTNTIDWGNNQLTKSEEKASITDPVIIELDASGNVYEVSSFPKSNALAKAIFHLSDSNLIELGVLRDRYLRIESDSIEPTKISDSTSFLYLRRWSYPTTIGLSELTLSPKQPLKVFPNPSNDIFYFNRKIDGYLFDLQGREVLRIKSSRMVSLNGLKQGIYFLKEDGGSSHKLFLK